MQQKLALRTTQKRTSERPSSARISPRRTIHPDSRGPSTRSSSCTQTTQQSVHHSAQAMNSLGFPPSINALPLFVRRASCIWIKPAADEICVCMLEGDLTFTFPLRQWMQAAAARNVTSFGYLFSHANPLDELDQGGTQCSSLSTFSTFTDFDLFHLCISHTTRPPIYHLLIHPISLVDAGL